MHFVLAHLHHLALGFALIPGSLIFVVVGLWRAARRVAGFKKPYLRGVGVVLDGPSWHRLARQGFPIRYALFEAFPAWLSGIWGYIKKRARRVRRAWKPWATRYIILHQAFESFVRWVILNKDFVYGSVYGDDPMGLATRKWEIQALYFWWTEQRPQALLKLEETEDVDLREHLLVEFENDDELHMARLANIWRDLT